MIYYYVLKYFIISILLYSILLKDLEKNTKVRTVTHQEPKILDEVFEDESFKIMKEELYQLKRNEIQTLKSSPKSKRAIRPGGCTQTR